MASDKIVIIGEGGYIAARLMEHFAERAVLTGIQSGCDITKLAVLREHLGALEPKVVINTAAMTATGELEKPENEQLGFEVNVHGPANLGYLSKEMGFHLVHLSTDMIYDGLGPEEQGFKEDAPADPVNYYAWSKFWGEAVLFPFMDRYPITIVRLRTPLSNRESSKNLLTKLQKFDKAFDIPASLTVVEELAPAIDGLIEKQAYGVYHVVNPGTISAYRIIQLMKEHDLVDPNKGVQPISRAEMDEVMQASGGARQNFPYLNTDKLAALGIQLRPVEEAVTDCITNYQRA